MVSFGLFLGASTITSTILVTSTSFRLDDSFRLDYDLGNLNFFLYNLGNRDFDFLFNFNDLGDLHFSLDNLGDGNLDGFRAAGYSGDHSHDGQ